MKSKIILLNYMKYEKKKDGNVTPMTRLQFAFADVQDAEKFKGVTVIDQYFKNHETYNKLSKSLLLKTLDAEFDEIEDYYDPLRARRILRKIDNIEL